jgi:hypothetical protein
VNQVLTANLDALKIVRPSAATAIAEAIPTRLLRPIETRDGLRGLSMVAGGVEKALHSRYDPKREAARIVATTVPNPVETVVIFGLEAGFTVRQVLERYQSSTVVVVERSWETIRVILEWIDLSRELTEGRLHLVTSAEDLVRILDEVHLPLLGGRTAAITVTPWVELPENRNHFRLCARALEKKIHDEDGDAATIRRFARRWLVHTVRNTRWMSDPHGSSSATKRLEAVVHDRTVTVFAAGPGLDRYLDQVAAGETVGTVFAVDTALPALLNRGIVPTAVVTLDPQCWTTMHFRRDLPRGTVLLGDAGVPSQIVRDVPPEQLIWYVGRHPLHQLLYRSGAPLFMLPTPVESVTEAAVVLARGMGAASVEVRGADGGHPRGKTYARDTYHYSLATRKAARLSPAEHFFAHGTYPAATQHVGENGPFFSNPEMRRRTRRIDDLIASRETRPLQQPRDDRSFDPDRFWSDHLEQLHAISRRLAIRRSETNTHGRPPHTKELMELLGAHGIAHLPVIARTGRENTPQLRPDDPADRINTVLETIRGFISSENRRYW